MLIVELLCTLVFAIVALFFGVLCLWLFLTLVGITVSLGEVCLGLVILGVIWKLGNYCNQWKVANAPDDPVDPPPDWREPDDDDDDHDDDNDDFNEGVKIAAIGSWFHDLP